MLSISLPRARRRWIGSHRKWSPHSDINMPGMDGLELPGEIKQRHPDLPVMMVTAYGDDDRRRRARELGACDFITKPVDFDQLKAQLRQLPAPTN